MSKTTFIIGIGNRARQGKDTTASFIKELRKNVYIFHWADALYEEVKNTDRQYPLIWRVNIGHDVYYNLLDVPYSRVYRLLKSTEVANIHSLMESRNLTEYWGMDEKDSPILQAWGTNFRRQWCDENYWVEKAMSNIQKVLDANFSLNENIYICVPDTRFHNEEKRLRHIAFAPTEPYRGVFVRVIRLNEDDTQYIDPSRNPNHPSESELEDTKADFTLKAKTGDLESLKQQTINFLDEIDKW